MAMATLTRMAIRQRSNAVVLDSAQYWNAVLPTEYRRAVVSSRRIVFAFLRPRIEDFKASVGMGRQLETMGCIGTVGIGDELCRDIVRRAAFFGKMQLPEVFQAGRFFDDVPDRRTCRPSWRRCP